MNKTILLFLLLCVQMLSAEELVFDMSVFGFTFGKMVVTKTQENDSTELYTLHAKGKTNFLWMKREDETKYEVRYRNGKLLSSSYIQIETGVTKHWTNITFDGKQYQVDSYRGKRSFTEPPVYSVLSFYFNPPGKRSKVFYEAECDYADIKQKDENAFEVKNSDNNRSIYHFEHGKVSAIEIHLSIATVHMQRVSN